MSFLRTLFRPRAPPSVEEKQREVEKLDAKRKHLRGKLARNQGDLRRMWTEFRTWRGDAAGKKALRSRIKQVEAERKTHRKSMLGLQAKMKKLGVDAQAGQGDNTE